MTTEEKWKANAEKVAFMKQFPGLLRSWEQAAGKTLKTAIPLKSKAGSIALVFSDGSFFVTPSYTPEPYELGECLQAARPYLEGEHAAAYAEYDRLVKKDREALRAARLEKILGAIQNNLESIPELKDRLKNLVKEWT
ncbi:hypothetical protein YTPLAS18_12080 [Nitrospira sp.]|nr:hypothetical protein YTPLAS18_12080 [Nitrospira sp.]